MEKEIKDLDIGKLDLKIWVVNAEKVKVIEVMTKRPQGNKSAPVILKLDWKRNSVVRTNRWSFLKQQPDGVLFLGLDRPSVKTR